MNVHKYFAALALALALCVSPALAAGVEEKFPAKNEYPGFADVPAGAWFEAGVQLCYEIGLMNGTDNGFVPQRNMLVSEVAAIAARMGEAITGEEIIYITAKPGQVVEWYQPYLDYLKGYGLTDLGNPSATATRGQFIAMLAAVVPQELLAPMNTITTLPDTKDTDVLRFYSAGILTGVDNYGTFAAENPLTRQEGAAMVSRVVREGLRKRFTPADYTPFTAAGVKPADLFFETEGKAVTAEAYLTKVLSLIEELEAACKTAGIEFNWNNTVTESGLSFLEYVKQSSLSDLEVSKTFGTVLYENFGIQAFYSKYLDLKGATI